MFTRIHSCVPVRSRAEPLNLCSHESLSVGFPPLPSPDRCYLGRAAPSGEDLSWRRTRASRRSRPARGWGLLGRGMWAVLPPPPMRWLHAVRPSGNSSPGLGSSLFLGKLTRVRLVSQPQAVLRPLAAPQLPLLCPSSASAVQAACLGDPAAHLRGWRCWSSRPRAVAVA